VAAPLRDGDGRVIAALNVTVHAAQTPVQTLTGECLPLLLQTAGAISADWARYQSAPHVIVPPGALTASTAASRLQIAGQVSGQRTAR
jgi:IclR family pca regulon transcriptional regulator